MAPCGHSPLRVLGTPRAVTITGTHRAGSTKHRSRATESHRTFSGSRAQFLRAGRLPTPFDRHRLRLEVAREPRRDLRLPPFHDDRVVVPEAADSVEVDPGLAAPHLVLRE